MKKIILIILALGFATAPALAQKTDSTALIHEQFVQIDSNGDGEISQEEFLNYKMKELRLVSDKIFKKLDTDKNGGISEKEYAQTVNTILHQLQKLSGSLQDQ